MARKNRKITGRKAATVPMPWYKPSSKKPLTKAGAQANSGVNTALPKPSKSWASNPCSGTPKA